MVEDMAYSKALVGMALGSMVLGSMDRDRSSSL